MASVRKRSNKWYARFKNERGAPVERATNAYDKKSAIKIARQFETDAALRRAGVIDSRTETAHTHAQRPIEKHLADFRRKMEAADRSTDHIRRTCRFIREVCDHSQCETIGDLTLDAVNDYASELHASDLSARSVQARLTAIKAFTKWLHERGRLLADPLISVRKPNPRLDRRLERRMLLPTEWPWLVASLELGREHHGMPAAERHLLYDVAIQTGLRSAEIRSLTRGSLEFHGQRPTIVLRAIHAKNKKRAIQDISADLGSRLRDHITAKTPTATMFNLPSAFKMAEMLRADLADARQVWVRAAPDPDVRAQRENADFLLATNDAKQTIDFHALRHTCGAWLALARTPLNVVQQVMRHASITLTIDTYGHLEPGATTAAIASLDTIRTPAVPLATGTDNSVVPTICPSPRATDRYSLHSPAIPREAKN